MGAEWFHVAIKEKEDDRKKELERLAEEETHQLRRERWTIWRNRQWVVG